MSVVSCGYGRVQQLLLVKFHAISTDAETTELTPALFEPAKKLSTDIPADVVFNKFPVASAFLTPRYIAADAVQYKIGVVESHQKNSTARATYFIDPSRVRLGLLSDKPPTAGEDDNQLLAQASNVPGE